MTAPRSGYDNTPTLSCSTHEPSMINLVVSDLLLIRTLHFRKFLFNTSVFYHPFQENCMADDASSLFYLYDTDFLTHISIIHRQLHGLWQMFLLPTELISCMISTLRRNPCKPALLNMQDSRGCIVSGPTSVPPCRSIILSNIHPSLSSSSSKSTAT